MCVYKTVSGFKVGEYEYIYIIEITFEKKLFCFKMAAKTIFWYCTIMLIYANNRENYRVDLKGLAMIFAGQENPFIIFRSKEIYIYFKTNNKIPINSLK